MKNDQVRLTVVSVSYNSSSIIGEMLEPLIDLEGVEIVVVDNASEDDSIRLIQDRFPTVRVIPSPENLGFARAVNMGASHAAGDAILLLNPDARIAGPDLERCLAELIARPEVGVLAPRIEHPTGRLQSMEGGRRPDLWRVLTHWSGLSRFADRLPVLEGMYLLHSHVHASREVDWVSGACLFIRKDAWEGLGGLTERWFMYAEDVEFCLRAQRAGWVVWLSLDARAEHVIGGSSGDAQPTVVRSDWVLNLYDLYTWQIGGKVRGRIWNRVVWLGLCSRRFGYLLRARRRGCSEPLLWRSEADKFRQHARALTRATRSDS